MYRTWCEAQFIPKKLTVKMENNGRQPQSQYVACDPLYVQPSFLAMHEAEVYDDAGAYPRPKTTWQ